MMENLYGLIGEKLGHTYSPQIHNKILEETRTKGYYVLYMLIAQAVKSQEIWNETKISNDVIKNILDIF